MNFGLSFTNPWAFLLWPPLAIYFVWLAGRSLADLSPLRRRAAVALRLVVLTLIVLALAGIQFVRFNRDIATMFVVDLFRFGRRHGQSTPRRSSSTTR